MAFTASTERADQSNMLGPGRRDVLVVAQDARAMAGLCTAMRARSVVTDCVADLAAALEVFAERGGHDLLVLAPDLPPGTALRIADSLRQVAPQLAVVAFGAEQVRARMPGPAPIDAHAYHPASRAGIGAVLKALVQLAPCAS